MKTLLLTLLLVFAGCANQGTTTINLTDEEAKYCAKYHDCVIVSKSAMQEQLDHTKEKMQKQADDACRDRTDYSVNHGWI